MSQQISFKSASVTRNGVQPSSHRIELVQNALTKFACFFTSATTSQISTPLSQTTKERRAAALRACGLVPPSPHRSQETAKATPRNPSSTPSSPPTASRSSALIQDDASDEPSSRTRLSRTGTPATQSNPRKSSDSSDRVSQTPKGRLDEPRRSVSPRIYTRDDILDELSVIQDDDTRRLTQLAYLG